MNFEERPGTSFTSKRQVQTEQRKRQQMNLGTLETEDKSGAMKIRPITQDQQRSSIQQKRMKMIPQAILYDRESLYEEVINAKQINNNLQRENQALQTKIKMMDEELHRVVRATPISEQIVNPMESFYQDCKPIKQHLIMDLKKQLRKLQEELIKKDQQIQFLQKNTKAMKIKELEIELLSYQQETQRLKSLIGMKFNETDTDTMRLRADNKLLEDDVKQLKVKCKEFESKATMYQNEKIKKDKLNQYLKNQIESLKFKDPEYKKLNKITENEQQLKSDIDSKQVQIDTLISSLKSKDAQYIELDKKMKELEREQQQIIDQLERERQQLREQCNSLKEEVALQSGRRRTVQNNSVLENKLEVLPEGPEINDPKRKLLPCVTKDDVSLICKSLKFKLKAMKVPYNKIENFIHGDDHFVVRIEELNDALQFEPFLLNDVDSLKVARYLVEDNDEKFVEFSMMTEGSIPRVKSILKNLIGNYVLMEKSEEDQLLNEIGIVLTKYKNPLEDYILKQKKKSEFCTVEDLEEALKFVEQSLNPIQYEYLLLKNYELTQELVQINYKKLFQLFQQDIQSQTKVNSEPDIPKEKEVKRMSLKEQKQEQNMQLLQQQKEEEQKQQLLKKQKEEEEQLRLQQIRNEEERRRQIELEKEEEEQRRLEQQWKEEEEEKRRQEEEDKRRKEEEEKERIRQQEEKRRREEEEEKHRKEQELLLKKQQEEEERRRKQEQLEKEEEERLLLEQEEEERLKKQQEEDYQEDEQNNEEYYEEEQQVAEKEADEYNDQQFEQQPSEKQSEKQIENQEKSQKEYEDDDFEQ